MRRLLTNFDRKDLFHYLRLNSPFANPRKPAVPHKCIFEGKADQVAPSFEKAVRYYTHLAPQSQPNMHLSKDSPLNNRHVPFFDAFQSAFGEQDVAFFSYLQSWPDFGEAYQRSYNFFTAVRHIAKESLEGAELEERATELIILTITVDPDIEISFKRR